MKKNKYKFVHIFPKEKFTDDYVNFICEEFDTNEHTFFLHGEAFVVNVLDKKNVKEIKSGKLKWFKMLKVFNNCESIILHGCPGGALPVLLILNPWLLKKTNIVFWGADLYGELRERTKLRSKLLFAAKKMTVSNAAYVTTLVKEDYNLVKKIFGHKGINFAGIYVDTGHDFLEQLCVNKKGKVSGSETINILVGNNGQRSNGHIAALEILEKYKEENINIFVPLSYSIIEEYRDEIINKGRELFGDKFKPIVNFMTKDEYYTLLNEMDIAIFNNNRQQALGNISALAYIGAKVYIRSDTSMWNHFHLDQGYKLYSIESINDLPFEEFTSYLDKEKKHNIEAVRYHMSLDKRKKLWSNIFTTMSE